MTICTGYAIQESGEVEGRHGCSARRAALALGKGSSSRLSID